MVDLAQRILLALCSWQVVAAGVTVTPISSRNCAPMPQICCVAVSDEKNREYLNVPENAHIAGVFTYQDKNGKRVPFNPEQVTVQHYTPSSRPSSDYQFYFNAHERARGYYRDIINWKNGEISKYGQRLAVCAKQTTNPAGGPIGSSSYTLDAYVTLP